MNEDEASIQLVRELIVTTEITVEDKTVIATTTHIYQGVDYDDIKYKRIDAFSNVGCVNTCLDS